MSPKTRTGIVCVQIGSVKLDFPKKMRVVVHVVPAENPVLIAAVDDAGVRETVRRPAVKKSVSIGAYRELRVKPGDGGKRE